MPDYADVYSSRGFVKARLGQYEGAIVDFNKALRLKPDFADAYAYRGRGLAMLELGRYENAISDFDVVLRLNPDSVEVYTVRGFAKWMSIGRISDARKDIQIALKLAEKTGNQVLKNEIEQFLQTLETELKEENND